MKKLPQPFVVLLLFLTWHSNSSEGCTIDVSNKCTFPIWPATAPNSGLPVIGEGGFYLGPGQVRRLQAPSGWNGRIWGRTSCNFTTSSSKQAACETGDCEGKLKCNGSIGLPPATLIQFSLQTDKGKPSFYDVSLVDGYNLPVTVSTINPYSQKCHIQGCRKDLKKLCPSELRVVNERGEVVACKSACLAFNLDSFCCRNEYGSPHKCQPSIYSNLFKDACPSYYSYAFDSPPPLFNCPSDHFLIIFCPYNWGGSASATASAYTSL